ncbi:MAG: heme lyase CcmF/NrfE family subunit, partial [Candidatus Puniceispirillaceae bacterium]
MGLTEFGHFALISAFILSLIQSVVPLFGAARHNMQLMLIGPAAAISAAAACVIAFGALLTSFIRSDFSVALVANHSHSAKPLIYKISGVWGNHEGSLLLWILILVIYGAVLALSGRSMPTIVKARILAVQGMISSGFLAFSLFTSNPFTRLADAPLDGKGLNPILQDPGLAIHPPMLYLGYVGLSIAFAFAVAGLIGGDVDRLWAKWMRPWIMAAWCALTLGIALGSWWAYYELGWGGWWFWDPVENASLMPWLAATALLHSAIVVEKRGQLKSWTVLLAILAFSLSLVGTFIVRSGLLTSVHSFASDPARGVFILGILIVAVGIPLLLYAWRGP